MFFTCTCAVSSLMPSDAAISLFRIPGRMSSTTCCSRRRQRRPGRAFREAGLHVRRDRRCSPHDGLADDANEIVRERVLQQIGGRARFERAVDVFVALIHRQHDDARGLGSSRADSRIASTPPIAPSCRSISVTSGLAPLEQLDGFFAAGRRPDHLHVALTVDDERDAFADDAVIVDAQDPDAMWFPWLVYPCDESGTTVSMSVP